MLGNRSLICYQDNGRQFARFKQYMSGVMNTLFKFLKSFVRTKLKCP